MLDYKLYVLTKHAVKSETVTRALKEKADVSELFEEKYYAKDADRFTFDVKTGDSKMFMLK